MLWVISKDLEEKTSSINAGKLQKKKCPRKLDWYKKEIDALKMWALAW